DGIRDYKVTGVQTCALPISTTLNAVVGRSEQAAVALTQATSFSNGLRLSFLAQTRHLDQRTARTLFHEQHPFETGEEDLPDGFRSEERRVGKEGRSRGSADG